MFTQKSFTPKKYLPQKNVCQKYLPKKFSPPKKISSKRFHPRRIFTPKIVTPKKFHPKNFHPLFFKYNSKIFSCQSFFCRPEMSTVVRKTYVVSLVFRPPNFLLFSLRRSVDELTSPWATGERGQTLVMVDQNQLFRK